MQRDNDSNYDAIGDKERTFYVHRLHQGNAAPGKNNDKRLQLIYTIDSDMRIIY